VGRRGLQQRAQADDRICLLEIIAVTEHGHKELIAVEDGHRESEASWYELLVWLRERGLTQGPKLAVGDGALGFWKALAKLYPDTAHQRCWVHKPANVLEKLPKSVQSKVKAALHEIWMAETRDAAHSAFERTLKRFEPKCPRAMHCLAKDRDALLAFYDFPAEHWVHIRTTNPIESTFATLRLRTDRMRNCGSRETTLTMLSSCYRVPRKAGSASKVSGSSNWSSTTSNSAMESKSSISPAGSPPESYAPDLTITHTHAGHTYEPSSSPTRRSLPSHPRALAC